MSRSREEAVFRDASFVFICIVSFPQQVSQRKLSRDVCNAVCNERGSRRSLHLGGGGGVRFLKGNRGEKPSKPLARWMQLR